MLRQSRREVFQKPKPFVKAQPLKPDQARPTLEAIRLPIFRVHYQALEKFIVEVYRSAEVDFLQAADAVPGLVPEFDITGVLPEGRDWEKRIDWIKTGRAVTRYAYLILELLCYEKYIPPGKYIIDTKPKPDPIEQYKSALMESRSPVSPQCVGLKQRFAADEAFMQRTAMVDAVFMESLSA